MKVTAVICAYWKSRISNVERIIADLKSGTVAPDKIIVLNNNKDLSLDFGDGVEVINSQLNSRTRGKYIIGLLDIADYYLLLDDDTSVGSRTLEALLKHADRNKTFGYCGVSYEGGNGKRLYPSTVETETETQFFLGCGIFTSFLGLVRLLIVEEELRRNSEWKHEGDDILIGLVNNSYIVPLKDDENFVDLSWGTEAMSWGSDGITAGQQAYLQMRDRFTLDAMKVIKEKGIPDL